MTLPQNADPTDHPAHDRDQFETPTLSDIDTERSRHIGNTIKNLDVGDIVRVTNNAYDFYIKGHVEEKTDDNDGMYTAIIRFSNRRAELHANWRDLPPDANDQQTPYVGLILQPFDDTAPAVTDIEVRKP